MLETSLSPSIVYLGISAQCPCGEIQNSIRGSDILGPDQKDVITDILPTDQWLVCDSFRRLRATQAQTLNWSAGKQLCGL